MLANCMSKVMKIIISKPQNDFVRSMQILDSVLIALNSRLREGVLSVSM